MVAVSGGEGSAGRRASAAAGDELRRSCQWSTTFVPRLVVLTGPIAAGKNTTAEALLSRVSSRGLMGVLVDLDDVAAMVGPPGAAAAGLWFAAHEAHGALVGHWMRADVDLVLAVGPIYTVEEQAALTAHLPETVMVEYVVIDAPVSLTLARALDDPSRKLSSDPDFHRAAHARFRSLLPGIPCRLLLDTSTAGVDDIARAVETTLNL